MPFQPESSVDKFESGDTTAGDIENQDAETGENYQEPTGQDEPAITLTQGQADAAGMSGAMPGDKFTVTLTVADQSDAGWNVMLDPGSAIKSEPMPEESMMPSERLGNSTVKGPTDLGMSPQILNT